LQTAARKSTRLARRLGTNAWVPISQIRAPAAQAQATRRAAAALAAPGRPRQARQCVRHACLTSLPPVPYTNYTAPSPHLPRVSCGSRESWLKPHIFRSGKPETRAGPHQGECMTAMTQGVRARSTAAKSARSHAAWALSSPYGTYEPIMTQCTPARGTAGYSILSYGRVCDKPACHVIRRGKRTW